MDTSTRGTFLNDARVPKPDGVVLSEGDRIRIEKLVLCFSLSDGSAGADCEGEADDIGVFRPEDAPLYTDQMLALVKTGRDHLVDTVKPPQMGTDEEANGALRLQYERDLQAELDRALPEYSHELPVGVSLPALRLSVLNEFVGYGPITGLLKERDLEEVMVNSHDSVFVAMKGKHYASPVRFANDDHVMRVIRRIFDRLDDRVDPASPKGDGRLPDGSRVNAVIPPLALDGPSLTIRKFSADKLTIDDLVVFGTMTPEMAGFLREAVRARQNILVSGGTGSGKTTLLNVLSHFIPPTERVVTIEDTAELQLNHANMVRLETKPPNFERAATGLGTGEVSIRDLVINALRMRPDRIIVGECRGQEAFDMLQAMNTGHDGSLTTVHANGARDALVRLENMIRMAVELPPDVIRRQIESAIDVVVQQTRFPDGTRRVTDISVLDGCEDNVIKTGEVFVFKATAIKSGGRVEGRFEATGLRPKFIEDLQAVGDLRLDPSVFHGPGNVD